jgi:hypothetical protein
MRLLAPVAAAMALAVLPVPAYAVTTTSTLLVYMADLDKDGNSELFSMPANGSAAGTPLFASATDVKDPALSPDGTRVAYVHEDETGAYRLFVRTVSGEGDPLQLTSGAVDSSPAWSRDGSAIAFDRYDAAHDERDVYVVPSAGGTPVLMANDAAEPSFAPSGRQLAVNGYDEATGANTGIDLVTLATKSRTRVAGSAQGNNATFSPDGRWLVFEMAYESSCMITIGRVPVTGAADEYPEWLVAGTSSYFLSPDFSRDGTQMFFSEVNWPCDQPADGSDEVRVLSWKEVLPVGGPGPAVVRRTDGVWERRATVAGGTLAADTTAPTSAPALTATVAATSVTLSWSAVATATEYVVLRKPHGDPAPASIADGDVVYDGAARSKVLTGLTTGESADYYAYALDASGNVSPRSAVRAARPTATPVLAAIPRPGVATATASFPVTWTGSGPAYSVAVDASTWVASTTATTKTYPGVQGRTYHVKVRGLDGHGNATAYSTVRTAHVPVDDRSSAVTYSAGWSSVSSAARYAGGYRVTTTPGASVSGSFETSRFTLIGDRCASCGRLSVYVDGVLKATVDTYAATTKARQVLWTGAAFATVKPHTIKVVASGTPGRPRVHVDGVVLAR